MCKSSDDGKEVTPVPMPNTEVKLFSADGSWGFPPVRVGRRFATFKPLKNQWFFNLPFRINYLNVSFIL